MTRLSVLTIQMQRCWFCFYGNFCCKFLLDYCIGICCCNSFQRSFVLFIVVMQRYYCFWNSPATGRFILGKSVTLFQMEKYRKDTDFITMLILACDIILYSLANNYDTLHKLFDENRYEQSRQSIEPHRIKVCGLTADKFPSQIACENKRSPFLLVNTTVTANVDVFLGLSRTTARQMSPAYGLNFQPDIP